MSSGYWYIATPYTNYPGGLDKAYQDANSAAARLARAGYKVFCPIAHSHSLCASYGTEDGLQDATDPEFWKAFDAPLLEAAHGVMVIMMPGWKKSKGVEHEIEEAHKQHKPVWFLNWPDLTVSWRSVG